MIAVVAALLHLALPLICLLAAGRGAARRGVLFTAVAGPALYQAILLGVGLALGHLSLLAAPVPLVVLGVVATGLVPLARSGSRELGVALAPHLAAARRALGSADGRLLALGAALATSFLLLAAAQDWTVGTTQIDGLTYHVPRALLWGWHGDFSPWPASQWQQVGLPVGGDVALLPGVFLGCGWRGGALTGMWLSLGAAAAVAGAARALGLGRCAAAVGALTFVSFPAIGLRLGDINTDVAAAFPLLAAWVLTVRAFSAAEALGAVPALVGAAIACKANVAPIAGLVVLSLTRRLIPGLRRPKGLAALIGGSVVGLLLLLGSYLPVRALFGDLLGGSEGRAISSLRDGPAAVGRATAFYALSWVAEPFAVVPEPPRFALLDRLGLGRAYVALGAESRARWYPALDGDTSRTGLLPVLALPWLIAALPRGLRPLAALALAAAFLALQSPVGIQPYASRFAVALLSGLAVLWAARAATHPRAVSGLCVASLLATGVALTRSAAPELRNARLAIPAEQQRLIDDLAGRPLWVVTGGLSLDGWLSGVDGTLRFEYLACPADGNWHRHLVEAARRSPWLLLAHESSDSMRPGPNFTSLSFPICREVPVAILESELRAAGWLVVRDLPGFRIWFAGQAQP